jgi:ketosteroid isomerase-like protein
MKTPDVRLTELCDRDAIRDLPVRYCDCVWRGDLDGLVKLFAEDGSFTVRGREREVTRRGRADLHKMYQEALGDLSPRPYIHNHVVDLQGPTRATGRCYVELRSAARNMEWIGSGYYEDEYVKAGEEWKFASRRFVGVAMQQPRASGGSTNS